MSGPDPEMEGIQAGFQQLVDGLGAAVSQGVIQGLEQSEILQRLAAIVENLQNRIETLEQEIHAQTECQGEDEPGDTQSATSVASPVATPAPPFIPSALAASRPGARIITRPNVVVQTPSAPAPNSAASDTGPSKSTPSPVPGATRTENAEGYTSPAGSGTSFRTCSVVGCDKPSRCQGLCSYHYQINRTSRRRLDILGFRENQPPVTPFARTVNTPPRREGTRGIFSVLYDEKGRRVMAGLINQMKYDRSDLVERLNTMFAGTPGVPLEEEDVMRAIHYHSMGEALKRRECEIISRHLNKQEGSLAKASQHLKIDPDRLKARIDELGLNDEVTRIRNHFREQVFEKVSFEQRLDLALTREKYLKDLGIEDEVDKLIQREVDQALAQAPEDGSPEARGEKVRELLKLDGERFKRLARRLNMSERLGLPNEPVSQPPPTT